MKVEKQSCTNVSEFEKKKKKYILSFMNENEEFHETVTLVCSLEKRLSTEKHNQQSNLITSKDMIYDIINTLKYKIWA